MEIRVRLFALARQIAGSDVMVLSVPEPVRVHDVRSELARVCPGLAGMVPQMLIAVNSTYAGENELVPADSEVAFIPPVSGG